MSKPKQKIPKLTRRDILDSRPVRNPQIKWEKGKSGDVRITLPLRRTWWVKILSRIFFAPRERILSLDEIGTRVWNLIDGNRTVEEIIQSLCQELNMNRREIETSLLHYLKQLATRGLVGFAIEKKE